MFFGGKAENKITYQKLFYENSIKSTHKRIQRETRREYFEYLIYACKIVTTTTVAPATPIYNFYTSNTFTRFQNIAKRIK